VGFWARRWCGGWWSFGRGSGLLSSVGWLCRRGSSSSFAVEGLAWRKGRGERGEGGGGSGGEEGGGERG